MAIFLAETYLSRERASDLEAITGRLRDALPVRHLFSCFVAVDETAFHCLQGPSPDAVRNALERAGLRPDRIVGADHVSGAGGPGPDCSAERRPSARRSIEPRPGP